MEIKNFGVYYVYCKNTWKDIFHEQLCSIETSNLLKVLQKLYVVVCYSSLEEYQYILNIIKKYPNVEIASAYKKNLYEFEALRVVKILCKKNICNILYFHTKGSGISEENYSFYNTNNGIDHLLNCVRDWRIFMEMELFYKTDSILEQLKIYDACGVNLTNQPKKHFSGNFWWSKSTYINKLPSLKQDNRWNAEFWIGEQNGNFLSLKDNQNAGYRYRLF